MARTLAGVGFVDLIDPATKNIMAVAKALTDEGLNTSVSEDVFRAGSSNARWGSYFYDSNLGITLTDITFKLEYLAMKFGGTIEAGGDIFTTEQVTTSVANQITILGTPVAPFEGSAIIYGWYKLASTTEDIWTPIQFTGSTATVNNLPSGSTVCVKYVYNTLSARSFKVSSDIIPDVVYAVMHIPEVKSGGSANELSTSSKIGELQVKIPQLQLDPNTDLALTSSGHATTSIGGNALINYGEGCGDTGYYAEIVEITYGASEFDNVSAIVVSNANLEMSDGDTETLRVYKMYNDGTAPSIISNSKLTFTASGTSATVSNAGLVTATSTTGVTTIEIVVTDKTNLTSSAVVTVA